MSVYPPPVDRLLQLDYEFQPPSKWLDYRSEFGLTEEHIPDLLRLATDQELYEDWREPESDGTAHAVRALAQLRAREQLPELLDFINEIDRKDWTGDWVTCELRYVFSSFGPEILPLLFDEVKRTDRTQWMRSAASDAMRHLIEEVPERRADMIAALVQELERDEPNHDGLNACLVGHLIDIKAVEAAQAIERAFATGLVDESYCGDWLDVQFELGLGPKPVRARPFWNVPRFSTPIAVFVADAKVKAEKRKAQRKAAKQARKRNRKPR